MSYERFTDRARNMMQLANLEAQSYGHTHVRPEHLLLALFKWNTGIAANALAEAGISLRKASKVVEALLPPDPKIVGMDKRPYHSQTCVALSFAAEEARALGHDHIGDEHLLLGLLHAEGVTRTLAALHVQPDTLRRNVLARLVPEVEAPAVVTAGVDVGSTGDPMSNDKPSGISADWSHYRYLAQERQRADRDNKGLENLWRLTQADCTVSYAAQTWRHGGYPSFEAMLLNLIDLLATEKARLFKLLAEASQNACPPIIVTKPKE